MNKLKGIPPVIAAGYMFMVYPIAMVSLYGWSVWNILAIISGLYIIFQIYKLIKWVAKSGIAKMVGM